MPPKRKFEKPKAVKAVSPPKSDEPEPKTKARGRRLNSSADKASEPVKKIKKDLESQDQDPNQSKSQPKNEKSSKKPVKVLAKEQLKTVLLKGSVPVDQYVPNAQLYKVYSDGVKTYSATLNQCNIGANNNKFYILQILQNKIDPINLYEYAFFTRWGRVGTPGQHTYIPTTLDYAMCFYSRKLREKTTKSAGYRQVQMNYDDEVKEAKDQMKSEQKGKKASSPTKEARQAVKQPIIEQLKKVIVKGSVPVDQYVSNAQLYTVYSDGNRIYSTTLNQCNIGVNNNKFYIIQILQNQNDPINRYAFFTRWGRVGVPGQQSSISVPLLNAIYYYNKKLREKTNGGYKQVQMNYNDDEVKGDINQVQKLEKKKEEAEVQSTLTQSVQDLIKLIFDMRMMASQMKEIGYDAKKMPLGKLAKSSIMKGYQALKGLMQEIKGLNRSTIIERLSSDFYSYIPHDFGFRKMRFFILDTEQKVKAKLQMLQSLEDIQVFTKLIDQGNHQNVNELDSNYLKLNTSITSLDKNSETYKLLLEYVQNTHAATHSGYKLEVQQIFELSKEIENKRYRSDIDNKQLLWHGSRLTNFVGILSQGLRIAPPQAPVTGYMFGKGVYFADVVSKSANYCCTTRFNSTGLMLLCEVALGDVNEKFYADYYANLLPPGKHSTKGCGKQAPQQGKRLSDGVYVPSGKCTDTNIASTSLLYNEYIVYDVAQIRSRYLFRMKFHYN